MNEALLQVQREIEECGYKTYVVSGTDEEIVAFKYEVPSGRYKGQWVHVGLSMQEVNYPEYPPHWIHVTPKIEDRRGSPGREFTDSEGRVWVGFSRPPSDFWDNAATKHMRVYLEHLVRFWRHA